MNLAGCTAPYIPLPYDQQVKHWEEKEKKKW